MTGQELRQHSDALIEALNARDFEAIAAMPLLDPEFEFHSALTAVEGGHEVAGLRIWAKNIDSVWLDFRVEITDFRELDDGRVLAVYRATGHARASDMPLDTPTAQIWCFREGRVWHNQSYTDLGAAFADAGLAD